MATINGIEANLVSEINGIPLPKQDATYSFVDRVVTDGATKVVNLQAVDNTLNRLDGSEGLVMIPSAVKPLVLYNQIPPSLNSELIVNGTFDADTDWAKSTATIIGGLGNLNGTVDPSLLYQDILTEGLTYKVDFLVSNFNSTGDSWVIDNVGTTLYVINSNGLHSFTFTHSTLQGNCIFRAFNGSIYSIDNVSVKEILPSADFEVARDDTATYIGSDGLLKTAANNEARIDFSDGTGIGALSLEPESENLYLDSELNNVENTTVTATPYTVFLYGTGTITFSGAFVGTLVGTGVNNKVEITFTPSAGTLTSTDSGSVDKKQIENLGYSTSYIPTSGSTVVRLKDQVTGGGSVNNFNSEEGVLFVEMSAFSNTGYPRVISLSDGTADNRILIRYTSTANRIEAQLRALSVTESSFISDSNIITDFFKIAFSWKINEFKMFINGAQIGTTDTSGNVPLSGMINRLNFNDGSGNYLEGNVRQLKVFKTPLTDAQLERLTQ